MTLVENSEKPITRREEQHIPRINHAFFGNRNACVIKLNDVTKSTIAAGPAFEKLKPPESAQDEEEAKPPPR